MARKISYWYLVIVPFAVAITGFALSKIPPAIYLPIWILNAVLMVLACRMMLRKEGLSLVDKSGVLTAAALLLISPWVLIAIFFGFGPPPASLAGWVATLRQQQLRYGLLVLAAVLVTAGFTLLTQKLKSANERVYSGLGGILILVAAPLFIINMVFWGGYLGEAFKVFVNLPVNSRPDWYPPLRQFFGWISVIEVGLIYLATAMYAVSIKNSGTFKRMPSLFYIGFSLLALLVDVAGDFLRGPFPFASTFVAIPAIPLIMPYLIGVNLLRVRQPKPGTLKPGLHALTK